MKKFLGGVKRPAGGTKLDNNGKRKLVTPEVITLQKSTFEKITVNYISKYFTANQLEKLSLSKNQYYVVDPTCSIENYFSEADVVIAGGGLIKYEFNIFSSDT